VDVDKMAVNEVVPTYAGRWCRRFWTRIHARCWHCTVSLAGRHCTSYTRPVSSAAGSHSTADTSAVSRSL